MLISNFNEVLDFYKIIKSPLITVLNEDINTIIGAFDGFNIIRTMKLDEPGPFLVPGSWLNTKLTTKLDLSGKVREDFIPMINGPVILNKDNKCLIYVDVSRELNNKYHIIQNDLNNYELKYNGVFSDGEFFDEFNKLKASDGATFMRLDQHVCMCLYKGMVPYNKKDVVLYNVYCGPMNFIAEFITKKSKGKEPDLHTYIRYLYV